MSQLKNTLADKEVIAHHMDFSENCVAKHSSKPQLIQFGALKKQLSLHTVVCYYPTMSSRFAPCPLNLDHAACGVWVHLSRSERCLQE